MCLQRASSASALSPYRVRQPAKGPQHTVMLFKRLTLRILYVYTCACVVWKERGRRALRAPGCQNSFFALTYINTCTRRNTHTLDRTLIYTLMQCLWALNTVTFNRLATAVAPIGSLQLIYSASWRGTSLYFSHQRDSQHIRTY